MKYADIMNNPALKPLRDDAITANRQYGEHINDTTDTAEKDRLKKVVADRVSKYNLACKEHTFRVWLESDVPMKTALLDGLYPALSAKVKGKEGSQTTAIEDTTGLFNVTDFIEYATANGYDNPAMNDAWLKTVEEAHMALCGYLVTQMHSESLKDGFLNEFAGSFKMNVGDATCGEADINKRFTLGNIDRALQALLDAILYEDVKGGGKNAYRVTNSKRNAVVFTYARMNPRTIGEVLFKKTDSFMKDITNIFCTIVRNTNLTFTGHPVIKSDK